jgi:hypothetical protein
MRRAASCAGLASPYGSAELFRTAAGDTVTATKCSLRKKKESSSNWRKPIKGTKIAGDRLGFGFPADIVDVR